MARIIAVANRKGGTGKTLIAVSLSAVFSRHGACALVDADPQASASGWIESTPALVVVQAADPEALRRVLAAARKESGGTVVVDCPPLDPSLTAVAVGIADLVVIPVVPSPVSLRAVAPLLQSLGKRPALVVLNQVKPATNAPRLAREALEGFGVRIARTEIGYRVAHGEAEAARQAVVDYAPHSLAALEIIALAREVRAALPKG